MGLLLEAIVVALLLAAIGSRLLGVRLPVLRELVVGLAAVAIGVVCGYLVYTPGSVDLPGAIGAGTGAALVATMILLVLSELVSRPAEEGLAHGLPHPWRRLRRALQSTHRYWQLSRIATRHRLIGVARGRVDPQEMGRRLRLALEEGGPIFVKLGQVLSTRTDLLPEPVIAELAELQDHAPTAPWTDIERVLEAELGRDPCEVFCAVDPVPIAGASLAQAHAATRVDGSAVILKVQRPGIEESVARDIEMIRRISRRLESKAEWARRYHAGDLGDGLADALGDELDFRIEARNIATVAAAAPADATVRIPAVHADISSRRLLVLERFDGINVRDAGRDLDLRGADREALARQLVTDVLRQILVQGTFHADPHPGNVMFLRSGELGLVDFGAVGRVDRRQQAALRRLLLAVALRDPSELSDAVTELAIKEVRDDDALEETLAIFMTQHLAPGMRADFTVIRKLLSQLADVHVAFPNPIGAVFRALVILDGTVRVIAPDFDLAAESQQLARAFAGDDLTPSSLLDSAERELVTLLPILRKLPRRADRITAALADGRLTTNLRLFSDPHEVSFINTVVNRAVLGFLGSALGLTSAILFLAPGSPTVTGSVTVLQLAGYIGLFLSITLIFRVTLDILSHRRRR